jgi:DNA-binding NarL/FixJ family response regulator
MKILLAETDLNIRYGLKIFSEQIEAAKIIGEATNGRELLRYADEICPDVLLISRGFPGLEDKNLLEIVLQFCPRLVIIVLNINLPDSSLEIPDIPNGNIILIQKPHQLYEVLQKILKNPEEMKRRQ